VAGAADGESPILLAQQNVGVVHPASQPFGQNSWNGTSITVRDRRAIGRWDSVVKKFRLAGRSDSAAKMTNSSGYPAGTQPFEDSWSRAPLFNLAGDYLNIWEWIVEGLRPMAG